MLHELLEREDSVKKTIYNTHDLVENVFSAVEEDLKFADITGILFTQIYAFNIS